MLEYGYFVSFSMGFNLLQWKQRYGRDLNPVPAEICYLLSFKEFQIMTYKQKIN